jgi:hypothetical protein
LRKAWIKSTQNDEGGCVGVDLGGVTFADDDGCALFLKMRRDGVELKGASSFIQHLLELSTSGRRQK